MNSRPFRQFSVLLITVVAVFAVTPAAHAAYPGSNGRLAFVRAHQIYTVEPGGSGVVQLTTSGKNYRPKWSPDGRRIAYVHEVSATSRDLWVMNADGSGKSRVTRLRSVTGPTWSPDGRWLAFGGIGPCEVGGPARCRLDLRTIRSTTPFGTPTVLVGNYEGTETIVGDVIGPPAWSPDGSTITFATHNFPSSPDRYVVSFDVPSHAVTMVDLIGGSCCGEGLLTAPQYSPDSTRLTVTSTRYCPECGESEPPSTTHAELGAPVPTTGHDSDAAFSPDGSRFVVTNDASGRAYLYTQALAGGVRTRVTTGYQADWQPLH